MKVKIFQDSIVFVSELTVQDIQKAKKFTPNALVLCEVDEDSKKKKPVCTIDYKDIGGVNANGIIFDSTTDEGKLCHTIVNTEGADPHLTAEEKATVVTERYASLILRINDLEAQILSELESNAEKIALAQNSVETIAL